MAKRTQVVRVDDLDGEQITSGAKAIRFALGDSTYEIDLTEKNAGKFHDSLAPYVAAARRVRGRGLASGTTDRQHLKAMRSWAQEHGIKVSARGRVRQQVKDAYRDAH